jgi:NAD(P)-dependent dehydrogenase (short-subunit alcohol dehydrogenase family)
MDKVCVVTGAAGGIGLGVAEVLAEHGAKVAMIDILDDALTRHAKKLKQRCGDQRVRAYRVDITDREAVRTCFSNIAKELGDVYGLVNNAGVVDQRPFEDITPEQIDRMMHVNVNGTLYCCQAAAPSMKKAKIGRIVNFSSKSGKTGSALMAHYSAAKGAVISLTHALAFELAPHNITVNCLCPGITRDTGVWGFVSESYVKNLKLNRDEVIKKFAAKIPLNRLTNIDDVVQYVLFLLAKAGYCTGQALNITGGREVH